MATKPLATKPLATKPLERNSVAAFETLMGQLDYPMFIVTTVAEGEKAGCLVGFTTQASIDPPRFLVGLSDKNHTYRIAERATHLAVHAVPRRNKELARVFGEQTGDSIDKFAHCRWESGPHALPILAAAPAWFCGRILQRSRLGDHVAFLVEPDAGHATQDLEGLLTFADVADFNAGHNA